MSQRSTFHSGLCGMKDGVGVDAMVMIEIRNCSGFAEMFNAQSFHQVTQPPRLVETVTSGAVVMMRSATASCDDASSLMIRPNPAWVDMIDVAR
jgi:hypothetical protein